MLYVVSTGLFPVFPVEEEVREGEEGSEDQTGVRRDCSIKHLGKLRKIWDTASSGLACGLDMVNMVGSILGKLLLYQISLRYPVSFVLLSTIDRTDRVVLKARSSCTTCSAQYRCEAFLVRDYSAWIRISKWKTSPERAKAHTSCCSIEEV